ncbi:MAG: amino acid permease [Clostridia bacterium]|nr:amino acid permease [Clostridia bacterium]
MNGQLNKKGLDRYLSSFDVFAMAIGVMVGWGAFVMPGTTFLPIAGPAGTLAALAIGVIAMLVIASNFAYLMTHSPRTGGVYSYTKEAFGRDHAFLSSWFLCLSYLTIVFLNGTALFIVVRTIMNGVAAPDIFYTISGSRIYLAEVLISVVAFLAIGLLFIFAKPFVQMLYRVLAVILVLGAAITAAVCIPHAVSANVLGSFGTMGLNRGYAVFTLVILAPWAFVGFDTVSFDTAHFKFPMKNVRKIIFTGIIAAGLIYAAMSVIGVSFVPDGYDSWGAYLGALSEFRGIESVPTFNAAYEYMGRGGLAVIAVTALAAIFTGIIGAFRAAMRVLSTMAEDHILSERFAQTKYSILFIMLISVVLSMLGRNTLNWFVDLTSFGAIVGFGYTSAAAYKTGRTEGNARAKIFGAAGFVISAAFGVVQLVPRMAALEAMGGAAFFLLALWCLLGFIFYIRTVNETTLAEFTGMSTSGIVLFSLLLYSALMWMAKLIMKNAGAEVKTTLIYGGIILMVVVFVGLAVMMYIQNLVRKKHEVIEREKIRAVEGSLAKSQFLFNMSHDIRTPMNAIIGYTGLAMKERDAGTVREYLEKIDASSRHLLELINDVLEMSRIESGTVELQFVPTDITELFGSIRELFSNQMAQKSLDFSVHTSQVQNRFVWCDKKNMTRVLLNVVGNAYKFTPEGGTINVSVWETGGGGNGYGSYEMRVRDSGIGMSSEFVERMFNAFERERTSTDSGIEGTGLGLAITKSIVDIMGGTIEVLTSPGSGTEIIIRVKLKLASESDMPASEEPQDGAAEDDDVDFIGKRLLLVEDNVINMDIASMILKELGFIVETAENGQAAVDMVASSEPGYYDAVLMDIQMPVMDGYSATRAIRALENEALSKIPILAMTANAFAEDVKAAHDAGMQAHIAKPIDINVLTAALRSVLSNKNRGASREE